MIDTPRRVQRSRAKGSRLPENTVCVTRPGLFGNPFQHSDPALAVRMFRVWVTGALRTAPLFDERMKAIHGKSMMRHQRAALRQALPNLRGKNLACWCRLDQPCHADVLLELANAPLRCEAADG